MLGSKGPQYVSLDEVREGQGRRLLPRQIQGRGEPSEPPSGRIGTSENPGPQRGGRQPQIAAGLGDRVSGLVTCIQLRQWFLQPVLCLKFALILDARRRLSRGWRTTETPGARANLMDTKIGMVDNPGRDRFRIHEIRPGPRGRDSWEDRAKGFREPPVKVS